MGDNIGPSPSLFDVLAHDTSSRREAARTALALAHTRVETHLGPWLLGAKTEQEFEQRFALVQSDFDNYIAQAAEEVGHDQPQHIAAALKDHYRLGIEIQAMVKEAPGKQHMKGVSPKRNRQYEHIKDSYLEEGMDEEEAKELAARTVNKQRRQKGETKKRSAEGEQSAPLARSAAGDEVWVNAPDNPEGTTYQRYDDPLMTRAIQRRFDGGDVVRHPTEPNTLIHGPGNFWDGPRHLKINEQGYIPNRNFYDENSPEELIGAGNERPEGWEGDYYGPDQYYNSLKGEYSPYHEGSTKEAAPVPDPFSAEDTYRTNPQFAHETCPNCGIALDEWGRCPRCGYQANDQSVSGPDVPQGNAPWLDTSAPQQLRQWDWQDYRRSSLVTCPKCGGDGKTANAGTCPKCGGRGRVADFGESVLDQLDGKASSVNWQVVPHPEMYAQDAPEAPGIEYPPGYGYSEQGGFHASVYRDIHEPESGPTEESAFAAGFNNHRCAECGHRYDEHGPNGECPGWQGTYHDPATYPPEGGFHASVKIADDNHGNTGLDGPEPKMDKSQGPGSKPDVPGKIVRKDPLRVIGPMRNDHPLQELGDIKQESLPSSENAGFSDGKVDSGPHTKTFGDGKHADPVTRETISSWPSDDSVSQAFATLAGFNMGIGQQMDPASLQRGLTQPPGQASPPPSTTPQQAQQPANQPSPSVGGGLGQLGQNAIPGLENPALQGNEMLNMGQPPPTTPSQPSNLQNPFSFMQ